MGFPSGSVGKRIHLQCKRGADSILGSGRSPGGHWTHSSISACRIPWTQEPGRIQPTGSQRVGHAEVSEHTCMHYIACFRYESESEVAQSCPTLCDPMDCSLLGSSIHGIFQARILEWVAISFSNGSSRPRDQTQVSFIVGRCFYRLSHQGGPCSCFRFGY